jgi:hypothetical protein
MTFLIGKNGNFENNSKIGVVGGVWGWFWCQNVRNWEVLHRKWKKNGVFIGRIE